MEEKDHRDVSSGSALSKEAKEVENDPKLREKGLEFLDDISEDQKERFYAMSEEERHKCMTENILNFQDEEMRERNAGISQLEHRINVNSFQG